MSQINVDTIANVSGTTYNFVKQIKQSSSSSDITTTSTSFVTSGVAVSITPSSTSSKIFVSANIGGFYMAQNDDIYVTIYRDSTNIGVGTKNCFVDVHNDNAQGRYGSASMQVLDSPSTTCAITYTIYYYTGNSTAVYLNRQNTGLFLTAMEVAG